MEWINEQQYNKILSFIDDLTLCEHDLEEHVLKLFNIYFGFNRANFWICDNDNILTNSKALNIHQVIIDDYLTNYSEMDVLTPKYFSQKNHRQLVFSNLDFVTIQEYEESDYYVNFMSKYGFYHNVGIFLFDGSKIWGIIDFVRSKDDGPFNTLERKKLEIVGRYVTQKLRERHLITDAIERTTLPNNINSLQFLTKKEKEVLELAKKGYSNFEIASELYISVNTVKKHMQQLYKKFNVNNRTSLCHKVFT